MRERKIDSISPKNKKRTQKTVQKQEMERQTFRLFAFIDAPKQATPKIKAIFEQILPLYSPMCNITPSSRLFFH